MIFYLKDKLSKSGFVRLIFSILPDRIIRLRKIREIIIEPTNFCNLRCPFCVNSRSKRPKGAMKLDDFKYLVTLLPNTIERVTLHFAGEPFLNQDLPEMIKILADKDIKITLSTNGTLSFEVYKQAVYSGLDLMLIALDGHSKEIHEKYRVGSNFDSMLETIKKISCLPKRNTKIVIQHLVMSHNEKHIPEMRELCKNLGVDELWLKTTSFNIASDDEMEKEVLSSAKDYLPKNKKYCRYIIKDNKLINIDKPKVCHWFWSAVILWNGDVGICCTDLEGKVIIGNVFKEASFNKIWMSERYAIVRKQMIKQSLQICKNCNIANRPYAEKIKFKRD
jgi:radical SAM protein with 4Fe4S-binding SPASM domain